MHNMALVSQEAGKEFVKWVEMVSQHKANIQQPYAGRPDMVPTMQRSVAIVPITGMIGKESFMEYYGGTSLDLLSVRLTRLAADPTVSHIVLAVNSPGGYVTVVEQTALLINEISKKKRVYAHVQGTAASAAYWLASAASKVYTDGQTARVGSIGVYAAFADFSELLKKEGIEVHEFVTGKYKALGSPYHAPSKDEKEKIQESVDTLFTVFVDSVAAYRGVSKDTVLKSADGQVFFAVEAAERKLTDGQLTLMEVLTMSDQENKDAAAAAKLSQENADLKKQLEEAQAKLAAEAKAKGEAEQAAVAKEANELYVKHMGRDATKEEVAAYTASTKEQRAVTNTTLEAVSKARENKGDKLTGEQAKDGDTANLSAESKEASLIVKALETARRR